MRKASKPASAISAWSTGYFTLNGKRILLKSTHGNWYDPVSIQGTPRDMRWLSRDFPQLKNGGFNTLRFIISAAMPEQLEQADEMGFLIWERTPELVASSKTRRNSDSPSTISCAAIAIIPASCSGAC